MIPNERIELVFDDGSVRIKDLDRQQLLQVIGYLHAKVQTIERECDQLLSILTTRQT